MYLRLEKKPIATEEAVVLDGYGMGVTRDETFGFQAGAARMKYSHKLQFNKNTLIGSIDVPQFRDGQFETTFQAARKKISGVGVVTESDTGDMEVTGNRTLERASSKSSSDIDFLNAISTPADLISAAKLKQEKSSNFTTASKNKGTPNVTTEPPKPTRIKGLFLIFDPRARPDPIRKVRSARAP